MANDRQPGEPSPIDEWPRTQSRYTRTSEEERLRRELDVFREEQRDFMAGLVGTKRFPGGRIGEIERRLEILDTKVDAMPGSIAQAINLATSSRDLSMTKTIAKYILGIVAVVVAGMLLFVLTHAGGGK